MAMRRMVMLGVTMTLLVAPSAQAQAQDVPFEEASDLVSTLVVKARTSGPAWWKVSDADTTVWILGGTDDSRLVPWDDRALQSRIKGANQLILSAKTKVSLTSVASVVVGAKRYLMDPVPYDRRLPPDLLRRFEAVAPLLKHKPLPQQNTAIMAENVFNLALSTPATSVGPQVWGRAETLAKAAKVRSVSVPAVDGIATLKAFYLEPETMRQECLASAIDAYDHRLEQRDDALRRARAWAVGDLPAAFGPSLIRLLPCKAPEATLVATRRARSQFVDLVSKAMAKPGHAVAVSTVDSLVARGGIIEQLRAKGYSVTPPDVLND